MNHTTLHIPADGAFNDIPETVSIKNQPGAVSLQADGSTATQRPMALNTADLIGSGEAGILGTARRKCGSPRMGPVEPTDIVMIEGRECQVQIAEMLGILRRDAQGTYAEVQGSVEALTEKKPEETPEVTDEALADAAAEADLSALCQTVSAGLQVSALQQIIANGQANPQTISAAASEARVEPSEMNARVESVMDAFRAQAVASVQTYGSEDPEPFFDWARQHKKAELHKAMQTHGMERSTKGYEPIYREYVEGIGQREPSRVLNAEFGGGITARLDDRKNVVLNIPGRGEMLYTVAVKTGLIRVRGA